MAVCLSCVPMLQIQAQLIRQTLQVNSYASRRIKKIGGSALVANDIVSGMNMILVYNESQDCYYLIKP